MNPQVQELIESTHCPTHGMNWEACCYSEIVLELHNKMADLLTTARKEEREAVWREVIQIANKHLEGPRFGYILRDKLIEAAATAKGNDDKPS